MSAYLEVVSKATGATPLVLVDGPPFTSWILIGKDFGSPSWQHQFSAARGTQGRRAVGGVPDDRQATFTLLADDYTTKDDLATDLAELAGVMDEVRRYGGYVTFREHNQTRKQTLDVMVGGATVGDWGSQEFDSRNATRPALTFTCAPYLLGAPMDVSDDFTTDNVTAGDLNYTADAGVIATDLQVTGGRLVGAGTLSTERRLIHVGTGYTIGDHEATIQFAPGSTITNFKTGVVLKRIDASNYLECYIDDNGTNSRIRIDKVVAASRTNLSTANLGARVAAGRTAWIRGRLEGNTVYAEYFTHAQGAPSPSGAPADSRTYVLTTGEAAQFGVGTRGRGGLSFTPIHASAYLDDFEVLPWTYRRPSMYAIDCDGDIPGDATALCDVRVGPCANLVGQSTTWQMFAWEARSNARNMVMWGDFERYPLELAAPFGWTAAGVSGVTGAATSINAVDASTLGYPAKYGFYVGQVVCPATANTGAAYPIYQLFQAGRTYTATMWVRASSGTTNVRIRLGVSGDISSSTAAALSTTWVQHTVSWTPTATVELAYVAVEVTAATATTFQVDGVVVYEGSTAPTGLQAQGQGAAPVLAVVRCEETIWGSTLANLTRTANANANGGYAMIDSNVAPAGESYTVGFVVDPQLSLPDDYSGGSVRVEVWARMMLSAAFTGGVTATLFAGPEARAASSPTSFGVGTVFTPEFGAAGRSVPIPSSGNDKWRFTRLGTLDLQCDGGRWVVTLKVDIAAGTNNQDFGIDDFVICPERSRWLLPTGHPIQGVADYPMFLYGGRQLYRWVRSDLSSTVKVAWTEGQAGGVSGAPIELPTGSIRVFGVGSVYEPDDTAPHSGSEVQGGSSVHLAVRPRFHWLAEA